MLQLVIPDLELFDEGKSEFFMIKGQSIQVEHSLVSISKWESKWNKPFLTKDEKTVDEIVDYIRCMTITQNVRPEVYKQITTENIEQVRQYIAAPMSATKISDDGKETSKEITTSEIIYYWMITYNIPFECQKWHLNKLITLIQVCSKKNEKPKKMSKGELINRNRALNEQRKQKLNTNG